MDPKEIRENAIRDAKCNIILDAARQVFAQKGYHDTRLEEIAVAAGFSKASLYNYYEDKETIFLNLAVREYDSLIQSIKNSLSPDNPFEENLALALKGLFAHFGEHFAFVLSIINMPTMVKLHADMHSHEQLLSKFKCGMGEILNIFEEMVVWGRRRGEVTSQLTDSIVGRYIASLIRGAIFEWKSLGKMGNIDETVRELVQFAMNGVK